MLGSYETQISEISEIFQAIIIAVNMCNFFFISTFFT